MNTNSTPSDWADITKNLNDKQKKYNDFRNKYVSLSLESARQFSNQFESNFETLEQLIQGAPIFADQHVNSAIQTAIEDLANHGIFDVNTEHFKLTFFRAYDKWSQAYEAVFEKYAEIVFTAAELDAYRTARRENRGKIIGGGFGLEGAVGGIAVAGAANMAVGVIHGMFNISAKALDAFGDYSKKNKIIRNPQLKLDLISALEETVLNVHLAVIDILYLSKPGALDFEKVSISNQEKARRIFSNLEHGLLGTVDLKKVLMQLISLDPYRIDFYIFSMDRLGDSDGSLSNVAKYFHLDLENEKHKVFKRFYKTDTESNTKKSIADIESAGIRLGMTVDEEYLIPLRTKLQEFDIQAKTFKGQIYANRSEAQTAAIKWEEEASKLQLEKKAFQLEIKAAQLEDRRSVGKWISVILILILISPILGHMKDEISELITPQILPWTKKGKETTQTSPSVRKYVISLSHTINLSESSDTNIQQLEIALGADIRTADGDIAEKIKSEIEQIKTTLSNVAIKNNILLHDKQKFLNNLKKDFEDRIRIDYNLTSIDFEIKEFEMRVRVKPPVQSDSTNVTTKE